MLVLYIAYSRPKCRQHVIRKYALTSGSQNCLSKAIFSAFCYIFYRRPMQTLFRHGSETSYRPGTNYEVTLLRKIKRIIACSAGQLTPGSCETVGLYGSPICLTSFTDGGTMGIRKSKNKCLLVTHIHNNHNRAH
jgi:hypothetical protein